METLIIWVTEIHDNMYMLNRIKKNHDMILVVIASDTPVSLKQYQLECFQLIVYSANGHTYGVTDQIKHELLITGIYPDTDKVLELVPRNVVFNFDVLTLARIKALSIKHLLWIKNTALNLLSHYYKILYPENGTVFNSMMVEAINYSTLDHQLDRLNSVITMSSSALEHKIMTINDDASQPSFLIKLKTCEETQKILYRCAWHDIDETRNRLPPLISISGRTNAIQYTSDWQEFVRSANEQNATPQTVKPFMQSPLKQLCLFIQFCAKHHTLEDNYCHLETHVENDVAIMFCPYHVCPLGIEK